MYLTENQITQVDIVNKTHLSVGAVHKLVNTGLGSKSTRKLVSMILEKTEAEFEKLLEFVN